MMSALGLNASAALGTRTTSSRRAVGRVTMAVLPGVML
jgi:hypothetical protein